MGRRLKKRNRVRRAKEQAATIARDRVARLLALADAAALAGRPDRAQRYATIAARLNLRHQLRSPVVRRRVCRGCGAFLHPAFSARVRVRDGKLVTTCLACGRVHRRPLDPARNGAKG